MQLTLYTDYAIRTLLYLAARPGRTVPVSEISASFGISPNHLAKVAQMLAQAGYVSGKRGRDGGLQLARDPTAINLGSVVRAAERHDLVECFDRESSTCCLSGACAVERALHEARKAFFAVLDGYTFADLTHNAPQLVRLLTRPPRRDGDDGAGAPRRRARA